ncbi:MAG: hypothetical protein IJE92_05540 [Clostridia bacterium]|nr:hypothetical protein [Clostridia bacterium]
MSDYKRLTKRFTGGSPYTEYASDHEILSRLAELEDKIENGTLIEVDENAVVMRKGELAGKLGIAWNEGYAQARRDIEAVLKQYGVEVEE